MLLLFFFVFFVFFVRLIGRRRGKGVGGEKGGEVVRNWVGMNMDLGREDATSRRKILAR